MITVVDYGLGNIQAFVNTFRRLGFPVIAAEVPRQLEEATKLILPGVGAFDWAISRLNRSGLRETLTELVLGRRVPVLGVCVGMQIMARQSEEGDLPGLGWLDANVVRFKETVITQSTHLPHMGWNDVRPLDSATLFRNIFEPRFYFLHSFHISLAQEADVLATTDYGVRFASAVRAGNIFGTQFHPEKSHNWGISLLRNFAEM